MADYVDTLGFNEVRADNTIAYISPNFHGFQFSAATMPSSRSTDNGRKNREANRLL